MTTILNEERSLPSFLASISRQSLIPDEVVIVDGGSTDSSVDIIRAWASDAGINVNVLIVEGAGISEGRNRGITAAKSGLIAVTDAGTILNRNWLASLVSRVTPSVDVVAGFFEPVGSTFFERTLAFAITPDINEIQPDKFLPSSRSILFRRSAWRSVGGYPEWLDYCEDLLFDLELKLHGSAFVFAPDALVTWSARSGVKSYFKQYYRYARGDGKAGLWPKRHAIRYAAYFTGVVGLGLSVSNPTLLLGLGLGFALYSAKYLRRSWLRANKHPTTTQACLALSLVPAILVVGDLAKMLGYPVGRFHRIRSRRPKGVSHQRLEHVPHEINLEQSSVPEPQQPEHKS